MRPSRLAVSETGESHVVPQAEASFEICYQLEARWPLRPHVSRLDAVQHFSAPYQQPDGKALGRMRSTSRIGCSDRTPSTTGMRSISRAEPDSVLKVVSKTGLKSRYLRVLTNASRGRIEKGPPRPGLRMCASIDGDA
jgi:hypothetical protein